VRFQASAVGALQESAEAFLVGHFESRSFRLLYMSTNANVI
jgi:hypothetical protein